MIVNIFRIVGILFIYMLKPKGNSEINPVPYNIQELLAPERSELTISNLMFITDCILDLIAQEEPSIRTSLLTYLRPLATNQAPKALKSWASHKLSSLLCKHCKNSPSDPSIHPLSLCNSCFNTLKGKSNCINCLITYENAGHLTPCRHLCIFCCKLFLQKGKNACKACNVSLKTMKNTLKEIVLECSGCKKSKSLIDESYMLLQCGHFFCSGCVKKCVYDKKCLIDNCLIRSKYVNMALEYISDICNQCRLRKTRKKFVVKNCCSFSLCLKCSKNSTGCPNCLTPLGK